MRQNRRPKVFYGTQVATTPWTVGLFTIGPELFDDTYQRYLLKTFRDHLPFTDVPIKLYLRNKTRGEATPENETDRKPAGRRGKREGPARDGRPERPRGHWDRGLGGAGDAGG